LKGCFFLEYIQALSEASKTDGIFPLITNTTLEACEVLRKYKSQLCIEIFRASGGNLEVPD